MTTACGDAKESSVVGLKTPTITTTTGGSVVIGSGINLTDSATLAGGYKPTGTITFTLTNPSAVLKDTETVTVSGNGVYSTPTGFLPDATGTWHWVATYSGDANNTGTASGIADEPVVVNKAGPTITTTTGTVGVMMAAGDTATFHNAYNPTGSVSFTLYSDNACKVSTGLTGTGAISSGVASFSGSFTPTAAGTYYWVASYAGDANNAAFTTSCGDANEQVVIGKASPSPTPTPTLSPSPTASPSPSQLVEGATATPVVTASPIPSQVVEGATSAPFATPPTTSTGSKPGSGSGSPLFALLVVLIFGGLGLMAVEAERRSIRP